MASAHHAKRFIPKKERKMEIRVGKVTHYFNRIGVAVLELTGELKVGDTISILGRITEFEQRVGSLEIDHHKIQSAGPGQQVALAVIDTVRAGDLVYKALGEQGAVNS
jgi:putative protease